MKVGIAIVLAVLLSATTVTYGDLGRFVFAGGSDAGLLVARTTGTAMTIAGAIVIGSVVLAMQSRSPRVVVAVLAVSLAAWASLGRAVGVYSDGRVVAGWFFVRTTVVDLRREGEDPEVYVARVRVVARRGWSIELRDADRSARLFVGPVSFERCVAMLKENGFKVVSDDQ